VRSENNFYQVRAGFATVASARRKRYKFKRNKPQMKNIFESSKELISRKNIPKEKGMARFYAKSYHQKHISSICRCERQL
jgi:hypothetical protein